MFHRAMVIEMVASKIRKHGHIKRNPENALLFERVRRDFHHRFGDSEAQTFGQKPVQLERFGRGMRSWKNFPGHMIFNRSNQRSLASSGLQYRFDEKRSRAFSIGPGNSSVGNSFRGALVEICAQ